MRPSGQSRLIGLDRYVGIRIAGGEGVVVGEDHVFGAVGAEGGFVVAADDGEGVEDVGGWCISVLEARLRPLVFWTVILGLKDCGDSTSAREIL